MPTTRPPQGQTREESTVATLANQTRTHPAEVKKIYDEERERLRRGAAVTQFIDVIAGRRTKARLKRKNRPS